MTSYEIFTRCFPELRLTLRQFTELSGIQQGKLFEAEGGFALVQGNKIRLLCVLPEYRGQGVGGGLLATCEDYIRESGFSRAEIGGTDSGLFIGAELSSAPFFEKRGYVFGGNIAEMYGERGELRLEPTELSGVGFGWERCGTQNLLSAVGSVDEDWRQYFREGECFCAYKDGDIASFCLVEEDVTCLFSDENARVGSIGCVGTVPEYRRRGIGLDMVAQASRILLERGCDRVFIHYTGVYDWYAKLGYKTRVWVRLGGKNLR
ncbi:MAG: GNAT family N-acetyltransferase [Oscillospiraceae bacterium]